MKVNIEKRGNVYQYKFEIPKINGKRKFISKSGFKTKRDALLAGNEAMIDYLNGGMQIAYNKTYAEYLDFWIEDYCGANYKYTTTKRYKESIGVIKKELGKYKLKFITAYMVNQALFRMSEKVKTKTALRNYQKVIKSSFNAATNHYGYLNYNPAVEASIARYKTTTVKKTD